MKTSGIIFDMDGTLWDSSEGVAKAWSEVIAKEYTDQMTLTAGDMQRVMGKTMDVIAEIFFGELPQERRMALLNKCCQWENEYLRVHGGILYPDLKETLEKLRQKYSLCIVSNCQSGYIEAFLEHYGFGEYIEDIECFGNNGLQKGENIRNVVERNGLTKAVYVGDIEGDYQASKEAGVKFIHAAYGFGTIKETVPKINGLKELPEVVEGIYR